MYSAVALEWDNMADSETNAVFRRAKLTDLLAEYGSDACQGMVLVPFRRNFDESDLTTEEYNLDGLLDYPVLADVSCIAINAGTSADGLKAAKSAALWLYSNGEGEDALTETLGVITPGTRRRMQRRWGPCRWSRRASAFCPAPRWTPQLPTP